jgi:hypothetical protein
LEFAGSQKERNTEENLEKDGYGGSRKMLQNWREDKGWQATLVWRYFKMAYVPGGTQGYITTKHFVC